MKNDAQKGQHAVVIGSSMAGLVTARVLADHFHQVTIIEKDHLVDEPAPRKGVPQGRHLHGLLAHGRAVLEAYYPGITQELVADGAITGDMGEMMRWYHFGGYKKQFTSGLQALVMSRPLLEGHVRRRTVQCPNIRLRTETAVCELLTQGQPARVTGVRLEHRREAGQTEELKADLVVDASGRGSAALRWLVALGYTKPEEEQIKINVNYSTRLYRREEGQLPNGGKLLMVTPEPPYDKRAGLAFPIEGNRWMVTLTSVLNDGCPTDEAAFLDFTKSLCAPDLYNLLRHCEPVSDIVTAKFPASLRRHYERLTAFPEGFLLVGDSVCSFNPTFGQGMTSAILQAHTLDQCLQKRTSLTGIWKPFFKATAKVIDIPWQAATGEDFRYPEVIGKRPPGSALTNRYVAAVYRATQRDAAVGKAFLEVMNLLRAPESLLRPAILWRVFSDVVQHQLGTKKPFKPQPAPVEVLTATAP